jgi:hypothetical protein
MREWGEVVVPILWLQIWESDEGVGRRGGGDFCGEVSDCLYS